MREPVDFDDWVVAVFDPEVEDPWPPPAQELAHLTRLFTGPVAALDGLTDDEIGRGLWSVIDSGGAGTMLALVDDALPLDERVACIRAITNVYEQLFLPRCRERLGHLDRHGDAASMLETTCYMFWDVAVVGGAEGTREGNLLEDAVLDVLAAALGLPHAACQESALHGLGHRVRRHPERAPRLIATWLRRGTARDPRLLDYAQAAATGCIQ